MLKHVFLFLILDNTNEPNNVERSEAERQQNTNMGYNYNLISTKEKFCKICKKHITDGTLQHYTQSHPDYDFHCYTEVLLLSLKKKDSQSQLLNSKDFFL